MERTQVKERSWTIYHCLIFEDEWVQVREEVHYTHDGFYSAKITRISDGKVLIDLRTNTLICGGSGAHTYGANLASTAVLPAGG